MQIGTYEASLRDRARELKRKFYPGNHVTKRIALPTPVVKPEWMTTDCWFNEHVAVFKKKIAFEDTVRSFCITHRINLDAINAVSERRTMKEICEEVLLLYPGITLADVIGVRRARCIVAARHACMKAVCDEREDLSTPAIGRFFLRDHTVVLYAAGKLKGRNSKAAANLAREQMLAISC